MITKKKNAKRQKTEKNKKCEEKITVVEFNSEKGSQKSEWESLKS